MGLSWQQGPLAPESVGHLLSPIPLPARLLFAEPLRRRLRLRVRFGVTRGEAAAARAAWTHPALPPHAGVLADRVTFAWRAMDAFYEEDERIVGHATDPYHRIDVRQSARHLLVRDGDQVVADTHRPVALYESGFAPRWYVPRGDVVPGALTPTTAQTFCPYKGLASYYDVGARQGAAWSYPDAWPEVARVRDLVSFEPDRIEVFLDGVQLHLEPGQTVVAHGLDRDLDPDELLHRGPERTPPCRPH